MSLLRFRGQAAAVAGFGPAASYNGTPGSGYSDNGGSGVAIPIDPTRVTGKPALKCFNADRDRFNTDFDWGAASYAFGGVASLDFFLEGTVLNVPLQSINTTLDPLGATRAGGAIKLAGYWTTISAALCQAKIAAGTWGGLDGYIRANPTNGALQARVIGPIRFYFSTLAQDATFDVGAGQTYATLEAALDAAVTAVAKHPLIQMHGTATTALPYRRTASLYSFDSFGKVVGVGGTHTLANTGFHGGSYTGDFDNYCFTQVSLLEFGPGLILDFKYNAGFYNSSNVDVIIYRFRGCQVTNSIGTLNTTYWARTLHPDGLCSAGGRHYIEFVLGSYIMSPQIGAIHAIGAQWKNTAKSTTTGTDFAAYTYINNTLWPDLWKLNEAFSITYTGPQAGASVTFSGNPNTSAYTFELRENGSVVQSFALTGIWSDTYYNAETMTAFINSDATFIAAHPGWAATNGSGVATLNSHYIWPPPNGTVVDNQTWAFNAYSTTVVKDGGGSHTVTIAATIDYHVDWVQFQNIAYENLIYVGNVAPNIIFSNPVKAENGYTLRDIAFLNNAFHSAGLGYQTGNLGGADHGVFDNNSFDTTNPAVTDGGFHAYDALASSPYLSIQQYAGYLDNAVFTSLAPVIDSYIRRPATGAAPNSASNTGNTGYDVSTGSIPQLFTNAAIGDFRPYVSGPLPGLLKTPIHRYDGTGTLRRSGGDALGAWSLDAPAPNWPF